MQKKLLHNRGEPCHSFLKYSTFFVTVSTAFPSPLYSVEYSCMIPYNTYIGLGSALNWHVAGLLEAKCYSPQHEAGQGRITRRTCLFDAVPRAIIMTDGS